MMPKYSYILITDVKTETKKKLLRTEKTIERDACIYGVYETLEEAEKAYENLNEIHFDDGITRIGVDCIDPDFGKYKLFGSIDSNRYAQAVLYTYGPLEEGS